MSALTQLIITVFLCSLVINCGNGSNLASGSKKRKPLAKSRKSGRSSSKTSKKRANAKGTAEPKKTKTDATTAVTETHIEETPFQKELKEMLQEAKKRQRQMNSSFDDMLERAGIQEAGSDY